MYQRSALKSHPKASLPIIEKNHIYYDPPKSVMTRKYEPVNMSDVTYMLRDDDSRINEGIQYIARGTNPMIDVVYSNYSAGGSRTTTLPQIQGRLWNAVEVVRPPMFRQEDLLPLSRSRHPETSAITNPGIGFSYASKNLEFDVDRGPINSAVSKKRIDYIPINPVLSYKIEMAHDVNTRNEIRENPLILDEVTPNFGIIVYDTQNQNHSFVAGSIKDRMNITAQAQAGAPISLLREDGIQVKVKEYQWKVVQTNAGSNLIIEVSPNNPEIVLDKNIPLYNVSTNVSALGNITQNNGHNPIMNDKKTFSAGTNVSMPYSDPSGMTNADVKLRGMGSVGNYQDKATMGRVVDRNLNVPKLKSKNAVQNGTERFY